MAANNIYVTVTGAGDKGGSTWANAMGRAEWETDLEAPVSADDVYYVEEGTYTLTEDIDCSAIDGTSIAPIKIIGVKTGTSNEPPVFSDHAFTTARPLIAAGGNQWWFGDYWIIKNIRITTAETWGFRADAYSQFVNCKSTATGGSWAISSPGSNSKVSACEAEANIGGISLVANGRALACYVHDGSGDGIVPQAGAVIFNCIIDNMTGDGIDLSTRDSCVLIHNTITGCGNGIAGTTANATVILNNIIAGCTVGANWGDAYTDQYVDYNCWDNTDDTINITKGDHAVTGDPSINAGADNFSITTASNCNNAALDAGDLTGATV